MEPEGFKSKTISEIRQLILDGFQAKLGMSSRLLPKSFLSVLAAVIAGVYITLYKQIGWLFLQMFPGTAYWGEVNIAGTSVRPLVQLGILFGAGLPKSGTRWEGEITVIAEGNKRGAKIPAGAQLQNDITGKLYITRQSIVLKNDFALARVVCAEYGTAGNLDESDVISFVSPLGNVRREAVVSYVHAPAMDAETEAEYRARVMEYCRNPAFGGALSDYRRWACEVPGVLNAYPCKDVGSPCGVIIYVSCDTSLSSSRVLPDESDLLMQVGKACTYDPATGMATRKPIGAVLDPDNNESYTNIRRVSVTTFDVCIEGMHGAEEEDFIEAVLPMLKSYFLDREPYLRGLSDDNNKTHIVSRSNIISIVDRAAVRIKAEFENVLLRNNSSREMTAGIYELQTGELAQFGSLFLSREEYEADI
ncbi:MAG: baseplate J/gp47 family protein [Spirochaetota bacterium]|jgi:hypothetical protein|nr:baseplate J/gp47 family protein [Spirochaetota bacterium]